MRSRRGRGKGKESLSCGKFMQINLIAFCKLQVDEIQPRRESDRADVFQMERRIFIEFQEKIFCIEDILRHFCKKRQIFSAEYTIRGR